MSKREEKFISRFQKLVDINIPIIYVEDYDFARIDDMLQKACNVKPSNIAEWNPASGYTCFVSKEPYGDGDCTLTEFLKMQYAADKERYAKEFVVIREIGEFVNDPQILSLLTHIAQRKLYDREYNLTVVISDFDLVIPKQILPYTSIMAIDNPDEEEIEEIIREHVHINDATFDEKDKATIMPSLKGLSHFEIDRVLDMAMSVNGNLEKEDQQLILQQKKAQVKKSGLVELIEVKETLDDIGGINVLKEYLKNKSNVMKHLAKAQKQKIATPKGVFIVGMPGCGKSLCAKAASAQFNCPLLKLDMGSMMGKYVGQSEGNLRRAIKIAEAASPCILWIDEIEKAFSGVGGNNDIMTRMFGYFLSWLQDKKSAVYVIATANNADNLPPELKRKGRFDEIFCVNLPDEDEREQIVKVHLKRRGQADKISSYKSIVAATKGYNGADIEALINDAMESKFLMDFEAPINLTENDLVEAAKKTVSISQSCKAQIENMEKVFKDSNFTDASRDKKVKR